MATLKDVAERAGVSPATVSRSFNEPDRVKSATRAKIQEAVQELGYRPSRVARRLRVKTGQSHILGLIISDIQNPFWADVARGVEDFASSQGYVLLLNNSDEDPKRQQVCLETMVTEAVDGVILPPVRGRSDDLSELMHSGIAVVCVDRRMLSGRFDTIVSDNVHGAYEAVSLFAEQGHRRIGYVGGIPNISTSKERRRGYQQALEDHGITPDPVLVREGHTPKQHGYELTTELLDLDAPPTAIFTSSNMMTSGALAAIRERGLHIPQDVAIIGYDDLPWELGRALNPPLTVVSQPGYEMGRRAAEMILQRILDPYRSPSLVTLQPELIVRGSCGSVPNDSATT